VKDICKIGPGDIPKPEVLSESGAQYVVSEVLKKLREPNGGCVAQITEEKWNSNRNKFGISLLLDIAISPLTELRGVVLLGSKIRTVALLRHVLNKQRLWILRANLLQLLLVEFEKSLLAKTLPKKPEACCIAILAVAVFVK
jgi:hypothetical protein